MNQKGFAAIFIFIALIAIVLVVFFLAKGGFNSNSHLSTPIQSGSSEKPTQIAPTAHKKTNPYVGVPCVSNPNPKFTYDLTDADKIIKITPPSLIANKSQDRAFLWINTQKTPKVPIYAPVDAD